MKQKETQGGFTLIELLVAISIIIVLSSVVIFSTIKVRERGNLTRAIMEVEGIAVGALHYFQDNKRWASDVANGSDAAFYNSTYVATSGTEPFSYLGPTYRWDWQNWGEAPDYGGSGGGVFPDQPSGFMCFQAIDLYRQDPTLGQRLVIRKCLNSSCLNQMYCDENGNCYDTAAHRDAGTGPVDPNYTQDYKNGPAVYSAPACEECFNEQDCANAFQPY